MPKPIEGTIFNDWIDYWDGVTSGADTILGHEGHDTIFGLGGNDVIFGGDHNDDLLGGPGDDLLIGGSGGDELHGGSGTDEANFSDSWAGVTVDLATGFATGGAATGDTFTSIEDLTGSEHNDWLLGNGEDNVLAGLNGNDTLKGGGGADSLWGGGGADTASYAESAAGVTVSLISGMAGGGDATGDYLHSIENLIGSDHADTLIGDDSVNELEGLDGNDELKGYGGGDTLRGGDDNDFLYGMNGVDTLHGEDGNDYLNGGAGADDMNGGIGNDIYIVDHAGDDVFDPSGQGSDIVRTSVSWSMAPGASIETLETTNETGTAAINLTGSAISNHLTGNDGPNGLNGGGGADQMTGHGGDDIYYVDNAGDDVYESGGEGMDEVRTSVSWIMTDGADIETVYPSSWSSTDPLNLTGNATGNVMWGNSGNNVLNGGDGNDELIGIGGYDSFLFDTQLGDFNVDVLSDFEVFWDTILLDDDVFSSSLGLGNISAGELVIGAAALEANDRIIYNDVTGALSYDSDGNGATAAIHFATLDPGLALTNLDFLVVA